MNARSIVQDARRYVTTLLEVTSVLALQASIWILTTTPAMVADNNELLHNGSCLLPFTYHLFTDINECATGNGGCEQNCNNTVGSYDCSCNVGFQLGNDYHACPGK